MNSTLNRFKEGDRVRVYGGVIGMGDNLSGQSGAVGMVSNCGDLFVTLDRGGNFWFHPKQCRKLIKRERRKFWVAFECSTNKPYAIAETFEEIDKIKGPIRYLREVVEIK